MFRGGWYRAQSGYSTIGRTEGGRQVKDPGQSILGFFQRRKNVVQDLVHTFENKALGQEQESARGQKESDIWSSSYQDERQPSIPKQPESWSQDYVNGQEALKNRTYQFGVYMKTWEGIYQIRED